MTPNSLIIVGAGMAGIKTAQTILRHQPDTIIHIFEANSYVGGRVRSMTFEGHTVEMGANWISGLETKYQNPIWKLAKEVQLNGHFVDRHEEDFTQVLSNGKDVGKEYFEAKGRFETIHEKAIRCCAERGMTQAIDMDVRSMLEECGWPSTDQLTPIERLVEYNFLEVWISDSLADLSASHSMREGANDVDLGQDEFFVEDKRGFNCIMNNMVDEIQQKGAKIHLNTPVREIHYAPGQVSVVVDSPETFQADAVVCTTSIGVLQKNHIQFSPPLPQWKTKALNQVKMFLFSKVYAKFDHDFWKSTKQQIIVHSGDNCRYPLWMRYRYATTQDTLLMCYVGGKEATRVESLTEEELTDEIEEHFRAAFGDRLAGIDDPSTVCRPTAVAVTDWSQNPHFCGSYSMFPVHSFSTMPMTDLTCGLTGTDDRDGQPCTLYFAGEGFDDMFNGWVQGAWRSGERVAKSILNLTE